MVNPARPWMHRKIRSVSLQVELGGRSERAHGDATGDAQSDRGVEEEGKCRESHDRDGHASLNHSTRRIRTDSTKTRGKGSPTA